MSEHHFLVVEGNSIYSSSDLLATIDHTRKEVKILADLGKLQLVHKISLSNLAYSIDYELIC